ncbi:MAG: DUF3775 domain-containing protein [Kiloniellales bacterium]|nr:DUF3775 domain-containing protein [Kiloniellales bacterium]
MLEQLGAETAKGIAELARAARDARDAILDKIRDEDVQSVPPAHGEHNPTVALGLDPLPESHSARVALREAVAALSPEARSELRALMWIGKGDYGARDWAKAVNDAAAAPMTLHGLLWSNSPICTRL